jgi:hypothetical protein
MNHHNIQVIVNYKATTLMHYMQLSHSIKTIFYLLDLEDFPSIVYLVEVEYDFCHNLEIKMESYPYESSTKVCML